MNSFLKFCPSCENNPTLCMNRAIIHIKCKCGYDQVISIKDYLNQLKDCNSLQCITNPKFVKITDKINEGYTHLLTYFKKIKDNLLTQMIKQINDLESSYEQSIKENTDILSLLQKLIDNYNDSKIMKRNIVLNSNIQVYKCKNDNSLDNVIDYYKTYSIINKNFKDLFDEDDVDCLSSNRSKISQTHTKTLSLSSTTSNLFKFRERRNICIKEEKTNSFHKKKQPIKDKIVKTIVGTIADKNVNYLDYARNSYRPLNTITNSTTPNKPE